MLHEKKIRNNYCDYGIDRNLPPTHSSGMTQNLMYDECRTGCGPRTPFVPSVPWSTYNGTEYMSICVCVPWLVKRWKNVVVSYIVKEWGKFVIRLHSWRYKYSVLKLSFRYSFLQSLIDWMHLEVQGIGLCFTLWMFCLVMVMYRSISPILIRITYLVPGYHADALIIMM